MRRLLEICVLISVLAGLLPAQEAGKAPEPVLIHIGYLTLRPSAFVDAIGMSRSEETPDSVATKFGKIPLTDTPAESIVSGRHSRLMLTGKLRLGKAQLTGYMESDFMNFTPGQIPYRWRYYWGNLQIGQWQVAGGQIASLLRPNRAGIAIDKDIITTDVIDPSYVVGLLGPRTKQIRVTRSMGDYQAAVEWESDGNVLSKVARDKGILHLEAAGLAGRFGRKGVEAASVVRVAPRARIVVQQFWAHRAIDQALGLMPVGHNGYSTLDGIEVQARKSLELYSYGGIVYASRFNGNRVVRQWTAGLNHKLNAPTLFGNVLLSLQYSRVDRELWTGKAGLMDFVMYRLRYTFN